MDRVCYVLSAAFVVMFLALPVHAKEGDVFRPFVSLGYSFDSNLFRLDEAESPTTQREDSFALQEVGVNLDWRPGRQQFVAKVARTRIRYKENTFLDFDGDDLEGAWLWYLGNRLSGRFGATQSTSQSSFEDIGLFNNQVESASQYGRAELEFHPRWRIGGGVEQVENINSDVSQSTQNFQQSTQDLSLSYKTPKGTELSLLIRRADAEYPNRLVILPFTFVDNSYEQIDYFLSGHWRYSGKFSLRMQGGPVTRNHKNLSQRDFEGLNGRVTGEWFPTGKTLISATAYQELGSADDINASFVLNKGGSLNGVWLWREKWRLNASVNIDRRDFQGDPGFILGLPRRTDQTVGGALSLSYTPHRVVTMDVALRSGERDSNLPNEDFRFYSVFANIRADF